jgi:hypothetical protein
VTRAWLLAAVVSVGLVAVAPGARAEVPASDRNVTIAPLSHTERAALASRSLVSRPFRFSRGEDGFYVGGVSYQVVRAEPREIILALASPDSLPRALPATESATLLSSGGRTAHVELVQGKAPFLVRYTVVLEQAEDGNTIRFWLDPTRPHDIRDVWGFFRVEPFGRGESLVTMGAALDLGSGLTRALFEDRVERVILRSPAHIRSFVEPLALASAR